MSDVNDGTIALLKRLQHVSLILGVGIGFSMIGMIRCVWPNVEQHTPYIGLAINVCMVVWMYVENKRSERLLEASRALRASLEAP